MQQELLFMQPVFKQRVWGGNRLCREFGYAVEEGRVGECWAISAHPNGESTVRSGLYQGKKLSQLWKDNKELFGNYPTECFPLLVKIIDAAEAASIQVHPDDEYAFAHEHGSMGKAECSYVLDCANDSYIIAGHNAKTRDELRGSIQNRDWEHLVKRVPIHKNDFFQINPGTVHAIEGNIMTLEIQENSDITYRLYDYDRLQDGKPRVLHIRQAEEVITVPDEPVEIIGTGRANALTQLVNYERYCAWKCVVKQSANISMDVPFLLVSVIGGRGKIGGVPIIKGDHFIVPSDYGRMIFDGDLEMIFASPK